MKDTYPEEYALREQDKYYYRYPTGEVSVGVSSCPPLSVCSLVFIPEDGQDREQVSDTVLAERAVVHNAMHATITVNSGIPPHSKKSQTWQLPIYIVCGSASSRPLLEIS